MQFLSCVSRISSRIVLYSKVTLPCWGLLVFFELLWFQLFILSPVTVCDSGPRLGDTHSHWQTESDPGCPQTLCGELCDRSACPSHTEQPLPLLPSPGHGSCCSAPDGSSLTENPCLWNHPVLHSFLPFLFALQLKLTFLWTPGTLLQSLPRQEQ